MNEPTQTVECCALCGQPLFGATWQDYDESGENIQPVHTRCFEALRVWDRRLELHPEKKHD